jgi:hypothetical protein
MEFNNIITIKIIDCVIVKSKDKIKVIFLGGYWVKQGL